MAEVAEKPEKPQQDVKLFNRWTFDDVEVCDWIFFLRFD
jgi:hypothetical protein